MTTTLIIPIYNRAHLLKHTLERLTHITKTDDVLIIDDGGSDNTEEVIDSFKNRLPIRYIYHNNPQWAICSFARNIGIKNTTADIILSCEPELLPITDFVYQMLKTHEENPTQMISAGTIYHMGSQGSINLEMYTDPQAELNKIAHKINSSTNSPIPHNAEGYSKIVNWQATFAALYRREWLMEVGGFDEDFPEPYAVDDIDLCTRIRIKCGVNQIIQHDIEAIHQYHGPPNVNGNATQRNMDYMFSKNMSVNGYEDPNNPMLVANRTHEWGVIKPR